MSSRLFGLGVALRATPRCITPRSLALSRGLAHSSGRANSSSTISASATTSAPKPKPNKSPSSLKRTASASLPIRSNPTPTRGAIQPIYTFATAERYDLTRIRYALPSSAVEFEEAYWTPLPSSSSRATLSGAAAGEAWVFRNGTVVCWGLEEQDSKNFVESLVRDAHTAQVSPLKIVETEELEFVIDPAEYVPYPFVEHDLCIRTVLAY